MNDGVKRLTAGLLSAALLITSLPQGVMAYSAKDGPGTSGVTSAGEASRARGASSASDTLQANGASYGENHGQMREDMLSAIRDGLEKEDTSLKEEYPEGIYSIANLTAAVEETNSDPLVLYLVRHGGTDGDSTVHMKLSDYSAEYGKDYYVKLKDSFFSKAVEKNEDSQPLFYQFGDEDGDSSDPDYDALKETYGEEAAGEIMNLLNEQALKDAGLDEDTAPESDEEAISEKLDSLDITGLISGETDGDTASAEESATAEKTSAAVTPAGNITAAAETTGDTALAGESATSAAASDGSDSAVLNASPLEAMNRQVSQYTGQDTVLPIQEQELSPEDQETVERNARLQDLLFPGTEFDVEFRDGEQIREIYVYPVNNDYSDGDRVFEMRIDVGDENKNICYEPGENSVAVTIEDDEPDETAVLSVATDVAEADESGYTEVVLKRDNALYKVSSVDYKVEEEKSKTVVASGKAVFMPGMDTRTLKLQLGNVTGSTAEKLSFTISDAIGGEVSGDDSASISLTKYKANLSASSDTLESAGIIGNSGVSSDSLKETGNSGISGESSASSDTLAPVGGENGVIYEKDSPDNPLGIGGTLYSNYFQVDMDDDNFYFKHNNECDDYLNEFNDGRIHLKIPDHNCACKWQAGFAVLDADIYPVMFESLDFNWCANNFEKSKCNRVFVGLKNYSFDWDESEELVMAHEGDIDTYEHDLGDCSPQRSNINLTTGALTNLNQDCDWKNEYMNFTEKFKNDRSAMKKTCPFCIGVEKTSGGINGMGLLVYDIKFYLKNFDVTICSPEYLEGRNDELPGRLFFDDNQTNGDYSSLSKINFIKEDAGFAYLKGIEISPDKTSWTAVDSSCFDSDSLVLNLSKEFFGKYGDCVEYSSDAKFYLRPVYDYLTVPVTIVPDENGGISVTDSLNGTTEIPRGTANQKVLQCNVGDTLTVRSYDVSTGDSNGTYSFTEFDMTPTAVNGGGDTSQHYKVYSSDPASIAIENCNYTLSPVYTHTGTKVNIEIKGTVPEGCGLNAKVRDSQGNTVNKTEYTYEEDKIRSGQILTVKADVADGYRAKWTIMSKGHENYGLTCYGDTLYYKIMSPEGKIYLTFEKMENPVYTTITGKVGTYDGSILNPPAQGEGGEWLSAYVPVANVSVQMGSFSGLSGQDGSFALYSHTEAADDSTQSVSGENVTTYLKLPAGVESEKHSMLVIRNGVRQCVYADVTAVSEYDPGSLSHNGLADNTPSVLKSSDLVVDFYGNGPIPVGYYSLVGNVGELEDPSIRVNAPAVELRNYSIGFHVELASVTDENGKDLVDRVKFIIFHKDGSQGNTYTVDRTNEGQTVYEFLNYQGKDSDGKDMVVNLNGLTDLLSGDQVYVEIEGSVKADSGETVPYSYGIYRSGSTFVEVPGEGEEIAFPDISSGTGSDQWGIPTLDVLGTMLPTLKFGKFSVKAEVNSSYLLINVGFDVAKLNKSLYDTREAERAEQAAAVKKDLDENNAELEAAKKTKAEADQKIQELESKTTLTHEEEDELIKNEQISTEMAKQIDALEQVVTDLNKQYEDLGGTTEVQPQEDPLKPADVNDAADKVDTKAEFTAEEISNPGKTSTDSFSSDNSWSPFSDSAKQMIEKIKKDSASLGTKGDSFKGTGSVSFNMNVTIGISVRFAVKANDQGRGEWCFDYATVYLSVAGALTAMYYMVFPEFPVPLYAGLSATASVGMYNGMTTAANAKIPISQFDEDEYDENKILYHGMVPITFGLEGFVGAGLRNLLCLEMGLGFLQKFNFAWDVGYDGLDSKQSGSGMTSFYGYLSTTLLFFSYKWKFLQANWKYQLYSTYVDFDDDGKTMSPVSSDMQPGDPALSDFTVNEPLKVNYYDEEGLPVYGNTLEWDGTTTVAEGLTDTISDVVYLDDGSFLAAYEGTLSSNDFVSGINEDNYKYNSRAIYLTWYDGENAVTCILQKDGTNDSSLHMEDLGDKVIISFASSDRIFEASDLLDDEGNVLSNALPKVLSSMDMYAVVLNKSDVEYFVTGATADQRLSRITRLTDDQADKTNITGLSSKLSIGADYLGYGYENGQAELIGDQIYLFYTAVDYNQWAGMEEITDLSDIIDAKGYEVYRIYDINNDKWTDTYASVIKKVAAKAAGMAEGARLADIHLGAQGGATTLLPRIGELDTVAVEVDGTERLAMAYIIEQDQQVSGNTSGGGADQAALFLAFMTPAELDDEGNVTGEPSWSLPLQMNEDYASITNPSFVKVSDGVDTDIYFMFGKDNDLKYMKLSDMLKEIGDTSLEESYSYRIINKGEITLSGNAIDYYYFDEDSTPDPSTAIYGGDDNKFSLRNGYRIASDDAGHIYVVWAQSEGNGQKLYISTMSSVDGRTYWSEPSPMDYGDDSQILENPSFCVADDGDMLIAHNAYVLETIVEKNSEGKDVAAGQKHVDDMFCLTKQKAVGSAGISSITLSDDYPKAGEEFTVTSNITNDGFVKADSIYVTTSFIKRASDGTEEVLSSIDQYLTDRLPGSNMDVTETFEMQQEYIDAVLEEGAELFISVNAYEEGYEDDSVTETADVNVGSYYVFSDVTADSFLTADEKTRFLVRAKVLNDGNVASDITKYSMAVSNENKFETEGDVWNGGSLDRNASEEDVMEELRYAGMSVVNNENFRDWLQTNSFVIGEDADSIGIGEEKTVRLISAQIPDECFSESGAINVALVAKNADHYDLQKLEGVGAAYTASGKAEERETSIAIRQNGESVDKIYVKEGESARLSSFMMPLRYNLNYSAAWSSSDDSVAMVLPDGTVTGLKEGHAVIYATAVIDGVTVSASCDVVVGNAAWIDDQGEGYVYTGSAVKPGFDGEEGFAVYLSDRKLVYGRDYTLSYKNNKNAATADSDKAPVVTVKYKGDFKGMKSWQHKFTISANNLSNTAANNISAVVKKSKGGYKEQKLVPKIIYNNMTLKKNKDFEVIYGDDSEGAYKEPGRWEITVKGIGNYTGEIPLYEELTEKGDKANLSGAKIELLSGEDPKYDPENPVAQTPGFNVRVKVKGSMVTLTEGTDYNVTFDRNVLPGKAIAVFTGINDSEYCFGQKKVTFKIGMESKELSVSGLEDGFIYTGKAVRPGYGYEPDLEVYYGQKKLRYKTDYTLSYKNNKNAYVQDSGKTAGDAGNRTAGSSSKVPQVTVTLKGMYKGMAEKTSYNFDIMPKDITESDVVANDISALAKTSSAGYKLQNLVPVIRYNRGKLKNNKDFALTYGDTDTGAYSAPGSYDVTVTGNNNYTGTLTLSQNLCEKGSLVKLGSAKVKQKGVVSAYDPVNPVAQTPAYELTLKVKGSAVTLEEGTDYTVTYADNVTRGKATVTFTALPGSKYCYGSKTTSFKIK